MEPVVYLNGELLPLSQAKIPAMDYGFLYGYGLFETMRAYDGKAFLLERHLDRLADSAKTLRFTVPQLDWPSVVTNTLAANSLKDARIRITVSIGEGPITPDPKACRKPTVLVAASEYRPPAEEAYSKGYHLVTSKIRRNSGSPVTGLKSLNYLESLLARQEAREAGVDEAIFHNEKGLVTEGSTTNIFLVKDGVLMTPAPDCGLLAGVTRGFVLELAGRVGIRAFEEDISPARLAQASEIFVTNSLIEIMPVREIDGRTVSSAGPVTAMLRAAYRSHIT